MMRLWEGVGSRFIPARAGNRAGRPAWPSPLPVHPRTCGEQDSTAARLLRWAGSSPHVRGTDVPPYRVGDMRRFIPARAGNRRSRPAAPRPPAVHPRTCGEQIPYPPFPLFPFGSSPHVRGTDPLYDTLDHDFRFIPARAGNSESKRTRFCSLSVHPRTCGEQLPFSLPFSLFLGSSPHVRGTVPLFPSLWFVFRFIPARAGNRGPCALHVNRSPVHPRTCGEQASSGVAITSAPGSSPHVRGTDRQPGFLYPLSRFIPARAGNRLPAADSSAGLSVHPRTCGEQ